MSEEHEVKLLSLVDVLEPLSVEELEEVSTRCPSFSLDAGQEFYGSPEYDGGLFLFEEGHVVIYKMTTSGKQITFAVHRAGNERSIRVGILRSLDCFAFSRERLRPTPAPRGWSS